MPVSKSVARYIKTSAWVRAMFEEGAKLKRELGASNVFDFSLGNPDLDPVPAFKDALLAAAGVSEPGIHGYMPNAGYPDVRAAIAEKIKREQGVPVDENSIVMTTGASGALNVILKTVVNPLDEVIILIPYFCEYPFYIDNHGGKDVPVRMQEDFSLDLRAIDAAITSRTAAVIITSPNNPTGRIYSQREISGLAELLTHWSARIYRPIALIADEPYRDIAFDGVVVPSVMKSYDYTFVASSFGKNISVPGERLGYVAMSPYMEDAAETMDGLILSNRILGFVNAPAVIQRTIKTVLEDIVDVSVYQRRRDRLFEALTGFGYEIVKPEGAFYFFPKSPLSDEMAFLSLLKRRSILAVPGRGYGMPGYFRIAYCVTDETIDGSLKGFQEAIDEAREHMGSPLEVLRESPEQFVSDMPTMTQ